jgi:PKD repeat protein
MAQLSGNFYIPGDFPSIPVAVNTLNSFGVGNGGVIFNVEAGHVDTAISILIYQTGTSNEPIIFKKFGQGPNPKIVGLNNTLYPVHAILGIMGADYITIDAIDFEEIWTPGTTTNGITGIGLYKINSFDGCHFITIKNCNISLQHTHSTGIRTSSYHLISNPFATASFSGTNSHNNFHNNTITGGMNGILLTGASFPWHDKYNEIGINGGNTFLGLQRGIIATSQDSIKIANNFLEIVNLIHSQYLGISAHGLDARNIEIYNNQLTFNCNGLTAMFNHSGPLIQITSNSNLSGNLRIYNNTIENSSILNYYNQNIVNASLVRCISNIPTIHFYGNTIRDVNFSTTNTTSIYYTDCNNCVTYVFDNEISNFTNHSLSPLLGIYGYYNKNAEILRVFNNKISGLISTDDCPVIGFFNENSVHNYSGKIYGNSFKRIKSDGQGTAIGIRISENISSNVEYYENQIDSIESSIGTAYGVLIVDGINNRFFRNKITNIRSGGNTGFAAGIHIMDGNVEASNNLIGKITHNGPGTDAVRGISVAGGGNIKLYYNSILMDAMPVAATFGTSGISISSTTPIIDIRNNIIINKSGFAGTGISAAIKRNANALTGFSSLSDNNLLFADTALGGSFLYHNGSSGFKSLHAYKNHLAPRESKAVMEDVVFVSTNPASFDFLRPDSLVPSFIESGAQPIAGLLDDYFLHQIRTGYPLAGQINGGGTAPDIGAIEGNYTIGIDAGAIAFISPTPIGCHEDSVTVTVQIKNHHHSTLNFSITPVNISAFAITPLGTVTVFNPIVLNSGSLAPGASMQVVVSNTFNMQTPGNYVFHANTNAIHDRQLANDTLLPAHFFHKTSFELNLNVQQIKCFGDSGEVTAIVTGNSNPFQYHWNQPAIGNIPIATGLSKGLYSVTVTDANGCTKKDSAYIHEPDSLSLSIAASNSLCHAGTGSAIATVSGGTGNYTYYWQGQALNNSPVAAALSSGNYSINVTDSMGCTKTTVFSITEPPAINLNIIFKTPVCRLGKDGWILSGANGGTGLLAYQWNTNPPTFNPYAPNLSAGVYTITIEDENNCIKKDSVMLGFYKDVPVADFDYHISGRNIQLWDLSTGNPDYNIWAFGDGVSIMNIQNPIHLFATPGNYTVTLTSINECGSGVASKVITATPSLEIEETEGDNELLVYPIPAKDWLHIQWIEKPEKLMLINHTGQVALETSDLPDNGLSFELQNLAAGVYYLHLINPSEVQVKKVIVVK